MRISRSITIKINYILDELLPPVLRDAWPIFVLPFKFLFHKDAGTVKDFKEHAPSMTPQEYNTVYERFNKFSLDRATDLNKKSISKIEENIIGPTILEVGCGKGYLSRELSRQGYYITGVDIQLEEVVQENLIFKKADIEKLPFADASFDTVICAHVLEHVLDADAALAELRRVARRRLIIVLPRQRPYKYTFDLHIRFFPYRWSVLMFTGTQRLYTCENVGGDWYYHEEVLDK